MQVPIAIGIIIRNLRWRFKLINDVITKTRGSSPAIRSHLAHGILLKTKVNKEKKWRSPTYWDCKLAFCKLLVPILGSGLTKYNKTPVPNKAKIDARTVAARGKYREESGIKPNPHTTRNSAGWYEWVWGEYAWWRAYRKKPKKEAVAVVE